MGLGSKAWGGHQELLKEKDELLKKKDAKKKARRSAGTHRGLKGTLGEGTAWNFGVLKKRIMYGSMHMGLAVWPCVADSCLCDFSIEKA